MSIITIIYLAIALLVFVSTLYNMIFKEERLVDQINAAMKAASNESFGYNEDQIVSSDIVGMRFGSDRMGETDELRRYIWLTIR